MIIESDEMLLHYEEYGGVDVKVRITANTVALYLMDKEGMSEFVARAKSKEMKPEGMSWPELLDQDERFYIWLKERRPNKEKAMKTFAHKYTYAVCYKGEDGSMEIETFYRFDRAKNLYLSISGLKRPVAIFAKMYEGQYHTNPLRKHYVDETFIENALKHLGSTAFHTVEGDRAQCRKTRHIRKCADCLRYKIPGIKGCPHWQEDE